jgi:hypothetical protein
MGEGLLFIDRVFKLSARSSPFRGPDLFFRMRPPPLKDLPGGSASIMALVEKSECGGGRQG